MFDKVESNMDFTKKEGIVEEYWKKHDIINKCLDANKDKDSYVFYDGPPTANGKPHIGHVETRAFKDLIPRYKSMKSKYVPRKAGWDTHGLPVELEVEKELGINGKEQIEKYGIEPFIDKCKKNVWTYKSMWEDFSYKVAFFADMDNPYVTYYDNYIESEWWALKQIWDKGLLYKSFKTVPYCPRCGTPLSSHEVAQGYKDIKTKTAYVRFKIKNQDCYFLAWTTTPWTLPSNLALCVHPDFVYVKIKCIDGYNYILAKELLDQAFAPIKVEDGQSKYEILETYKGKNLENIEYEPLYDYAVPLIKKQNKKAFIVISDTYVANDSGTGIVHIAPAFGEDDNRVSRKWDIGFVQFVDNNGMLTSQTKFAGKTTNEADPLILKDLEERNILFHAPTVTHAYPHCWRCNTPLIYYARESWFIKMTSVKDDLIKNNNMIRWYPESIGKGRFGDWIENVQDWGISRNRYWGTPLPIWECECGHQECIGSKKELKQKAIDLNGKDVELHKPFIDNVHLKCPKCGKEMTRVKEVIDCWFDSGAMPYAQHHYPFENKEIFEKQFPANFICEAVDQTRGWFYSLLAESTLLFNKPSFLNCLVLGHVQDENGQKMSKSKGNAVEPMEALSTYGADAIRWFFYTNSQAWLPKRFSGKVVQEGQNKFLGTLHNVYVFFVLYANIDNFVPVDYDYVKNGKLIKKPESEMDRWLLSKLNIVIDKVDKYLDEYKIMEPAELLQDFVDELSNWYIRRSRERFWASGMEKDKIEAYITLWYVLLQTSKLIAPFVPFVSETIYLNITKNSGFDYFKESVHLENYPEVDNDFIDKKQEEQMNKAITVVELGRSCRNEAKVKNRQPLSKILVKVDTVLDSHYKEIIEQELNIKECIFKDDLSTYTEYVFKPQLKTVGPKYGKNLNGIKEYLSNVNGSKAYQELKEKGSLKFVVNNVDIDLKEEDLLIEASKKEGYVTAISNNTTVVLDTNLTKELIDEGIVREVVSKIQTMRKESNFDVMDRIDVYFAGDDEILKVIDNYNEMILKDIMCNNIYIDKKYDGGISKEWDINDKKLLITITK